jgi:hypothetical protein
MTRKDYEIIAAVLRRTKPVGSNWSKDNYASWRGIVREFAEQLALGNSRFQADRFEAACGVDFGVKA